ncbi:transglycosylase SLT domain-containing protein [Jatrophihabitans sp. YIM 134969]
MTATTSAPATTTSGTSSGGSGDQFGITLSGVANAVKSIEGLVGSSTGTAGQVASAVLDVLSFAGIGSTVGAQNTALNAKHVESLQKVLELITKIKGLVEQAAQGYADADQATAKGFGGDQSGPGTTPGTTTPAAAAAPGDGSADTAAQTGGAEDTGGPNHNGLPDYVSPNAHPAVVGHDRQGHSLYDMTGHEAPSTRPAGDLDSWITDAKSALSAHGVDTSSMSDSDLRTLIQHESSGNPHALNNWDSNARRGIPSKGLMQTIDPTFNDYALPGHTDIWNPTDNIIAGVRYGIERYGSFDRIPGVRALHRGGGYVGY